MTATANYTGARYDVRIVRGDDVKETFTFRDSNGDILNLSGYTFASQVRDAPAPEGDVIGEFNCTVEAEAGTVTRILSNAFTTPMEPGVYFHDLQWVDDDGHVKTLLSGKFRVFPEVTRV